MEGLFFAVPPIWWSGQTPIISLLVASTIAMMYVVYRFMKTMKPLIESRGEDFIFTSEQDEKWAEKTLERLKTHLTSIYYPAHTTSHTVEEIRHYITNQDLLGILDKLETIEYSKKELDIEDRKSINSKLAKIIPTLEKTKNH